MGFFVCFFFFENLSHFNTHDYDILVNILDKKYAKLFVIKEMHLTGWSPLYKQVLSFPPVSVKNKTFFYISLNCVLTHQLRHRHQARGTIKIHFGHFVGPWYFTSPLFVLGSVRCSSALCLFIINLY